MKPSDIDKIFRMMEEMMDKGFSGGYNYIGEEQSTSQYDDNPLVDIHEDNKYVYLTIELCDLREEDFKVIVEPEWLILEILLNGKMYEKSFKLPYPVKTKNKKITFNNGILDVVLRKDEKYEREENRSIRNPTCSRTNPR